MVKNPEATVENMQNSSKTQGLQWRRWLFYLTFTVILAGGGWFLWQNPAFLQKLRSVDNTDDLMQMQNQIKELQQETARLRQKSEIAVSMQDIALLNEKIDNLSRINTEILDSKASNAAILGLISRVDNLETKVSNLGKVSSQGALILTAAMLVKDSAAGGEPFEYEAEVLRQLAMGTNMQPASETIAAYAAKGILSKQKLTAEFNRLYAENQIAQEFEAKQQAAEQTGAVEAKTWKDKINSKLSELIIIEKHEEKAAENPQAQDEVYRLVNAGEFNLALVKMADDEKYQSQAFKQWQNEVKGKEGFTRALQQIQALAMGVMRAESLKAIGQ